MKRVEEPEEEEETPDHLIKTLLSINAHPDDLAILLTKASKRQEWDPLVHSSSQKSSNSLSVKYFCGNGFYEETQSFSYS